MIDLVRTRGGLVIHRKDCQYAGTGLPWNWAAEKTPDEILNAMDQYGIRACLKCRPIERTV